MGMLMLGVRVLRLAIVVLVKCDMKGLRVSAFHKF
jgi:hypothetical protein